MSQTTPHESIIRQRGGVTSTPKPARGVDAEGIYMPSESEQFSYGFLLLRTSGHVDRFAYASLGDLSYQAGEHGEYISFTHCSKAVTIKGQNLFPLIDLMNGHTLIALHQHDGKMPYRQSKPVIERVSIVQAS